MENEVKSAYKKKIEGIFRLILSQNTIKPLYIKWISNKNEISI